MWVLVTGDGTVVNVDGESVAGFPQVLMRGIAPPEREFVVACINAARRVESLRCAFAVLIEVRDEEVVRVARWTGEFFEPEPE